MRSLPRQVNAARVVPVRGRRDVPGPDGGGYLELYQAEDEGDSLRLPVAGGGTDEEGRFLLEQRVEAGSYLIEARTRHSWAKHLVRIGPDEASAVVPMQPMLSVAGAATWDGRTRPPDLSELMVPVRSGPSSEPHVIVAFKPIDWVFGRRNWGIGSQQKLLDQGVVIEGLLPGRYLVDEDFFARWHLLSARINGVEATEEPVIINTDVVDATFRFTRQVGRLRGRVATQTGEPDPDAVVVLFATDRRLWPTAHSSFRFAQATTVSVDGEFIFEVHPGLYFVAADDPDDGTVLTVDRFTRLRPTATQVRADVGETVTQALRRR